MPYKFNNNKIFESTSNGHELQTSDRKLFKLYPSFFILCLTSRVMLNSVTATRSLYLKDMVFKNKATENELLRQSALGPKLFGGKFLKICTAVQRT